MYAQIVRERLPQVRETLMVAAERSGRDADSVCLIAVTKGHPPEAITAVLEAEIRDIGENRVEELERKVPLFQAQQVRWHMIGHLQGRKVGRAAALVQVVHSVDSVRLAERLSRAGEGLQKRLEVLIQVNTSGEATKGGIEPTEAIDEIARIAEFEWLDPVGLMTMAPFTENETVIRSTFQAARRLLEEAAEIPGFTPKELSMGMSNDYPIAIEEGSTMVRLGTALLGERQA